MVNEQVEENQLEGCEGPSAVGRVSMKLGGLNLDGASSSVPPDLVPEYDRPSTAASSDFMPIRSCELVWEHNICKEDASLRIKSLEFLLDGTVCFVKAKVEKKKNGNYSTTSSDIGCYNLKGEVANLPFPTGAIAKPMHITARHDENRFAIHSWDSKSIVYMYTKVKGWTCKTYSVDKEMQNISLGVNGEIVSDQHSAGKHNLTKFDINGKQLWTKYIVDNLPKVKVDNKNNIFVSIPEKKEMRYYDPEGNLISRCKQTFLKDPQGICVDSNGNVYIGDAADRTIHQFSPEGEYLQLIVKSTIYPTCIAIYQDNYLAIAARGDGNVGLYKMKWGL